MPTFFDRHLRLISPLQAEVDYPQDQHELAITMEGPLETEIGAMISKMEGEKVIALENDKWTATVQTEQTKTLKVRVPGPGMYLLQMFAGRRGEEQLSLALEYKIKAPNAPIGADGYPKFFAAFGLHCLELISPTSAPLRASNSPVQIKIKGGTNRTEKLMARMGQHWIPLHKKGEHHEASVTLKNTSELQIYVEEGANHYSQLLSYEVVQ